MKFSERIGKTPPKPLKTLEDMDDDLRNTIWSLFDFYIKLLDPDLSRIVRIEDTEFFWFFSFRLRFLFWKQPVDQQKPLPSTELAWVREEFFRLNSVGIYDFLDFSISEIREHLLKRGKREDANEILDSFNTSLEREKAPVRFVDGQLVEITNEEEIKEIESAMGDPLSDVKTQIKKALNAFSDRQAPDYEITITEAVKAVEAKLHDLAGTTGTMDKALKRLANEGKLDGQLKEAMTKLYAFRGRHSHGKSSNAKVKTKVSASEARLTLIVASALINFLEETVGQIN